MKKFVVLFVFGVSAFLVHGQTITVADKATLRPIEGVTLTAHDPLVQVVTDARGQADITVLKGRDHIAIRHVAFKPVERNYAELMAATSPFLLDLQAYTLDEFVSSASRFDEERRDVPEKVDVITARRIESTEARTAADLLQNTGTVFVQKSQLGGGSPVIRGFEASKVLLVVDGIRMNNAIYRAGHLQDIITVDQNALEKVEVISGPASVAYGSDALGGVVHFYTRAPRFRDGSGKAVVGEAFTRYSSANNEITAHAGIELRTERISSYTSITLSDFGDLRQGSTRNPFYEDFGRRPWYVERINGVDSAVVNDDSNVQVGSAYKQMDLLEKLRLRGKACVHELNFQLSTSTDVPRYDRLTQVRDGAPRYAEWYYGPQKRMLIAYSMEMERDSAFFNKARITPSYQLVEQSRNNRGYRKDGLTGQVEKVNVFALNVDMEKRSGRHEFRYGMEGTYNDVSSTAGIKNIISGEVMPAQARYADGGANMTTAAAYVSHTMELNEKFIMSEGLRFTYTGLEATFVDTTWFPFLVGTTKQHHTALSGRLGFMYIPGRDWRFSLLGSTGFRAPNVDDLSKVFESEPGQVIVPNTGLKPEKTYNVEVGIGKTIGSLVTLNGTAFYTWYRDALTVGDFQLNGQDSILYDGVMSNVVAVTNAGKAHILGASGEIIIPFDRVFTLRSSLTYTYGRIETDTTDYPLDHIPPVYGRTGLEWSVRKFRGEVYALYNCWKRMKDYNLFGEDNDAYATEFGMPAWYTLNARVAYSLNKGLAVQAGLENILDENYRTFSSNISAPGRNLTISLRAMF
ncbi:MAG: TonB-dependent receptor [Flavobacteriales bacterium]|nr:TonB-dependent receptor [Flavobacteriales bacterium]MCB9170444.1 TonB-dependent receptor [Flavobacteriales bacterium]